MFRRSLLGSVELKVEGTGRAEGRRDSMAFQGTQGGSRWCRCRVGKCTAACSVVEW